MTRVCINGHIVDAANTYVSPRGKRCCRTCRSNSVARRRKGLDPEGRPALTGETGLELAMTQDEIAVRLGLTSSRVGQLERRALSKMRAEAKRLGICFEELFTP